MRIGTRSLGEFPLDVVRIDCEHCGRAGRYRLTGLIERFGPNAAVLDVLLELANCERRKDFSAPCGARFTDLVARREEAIRAAVFRSPQDPRPRTPRERPG